MLYHLAQDFSTEMWRQGEDGNPYLTMDHQAYSFYFKHLLDTYKLTYKSALKSSDTDTLLLLYRKVCSLLQWKVDNKEYSYIDRYVKLKKTLEACPLLKDAFSAQ